VIHPSQAIRLIHINLVLLRHGLDEVILATHLFRPIRFLIYLSPWFWFRKDRSPHPVRIRRALEDLGPIFVKFGQILSTRRDLLHDDLADELAKLQDRVPPFSGVKARAIIEKAYGKPVDELLEAFDEQPLASASIAQVHTAQLKDGKKVVVKVLRPQIEKTIRRDVDLLYTIARLAEKYWKEGRRLRPVEVVQEYEKTIFDELDLMREAANASQLRRNFLNSEILYVPEVYWDLTRQNVLVMERISGTPVGDINALKQQGISMKLLGERGVEIFFTQVFKFNFFHADMHPGNIFVESNGRYIAVDFGIMGTLTEEDKRYLAENLLAFFNRDYKRVAQLHIQSGWVPEGTRVEEFESAIRTVSEPIFEKPLSEISFGHFLLKLFQTARRFDMEVQPQLVLLQKTLLNIEGLGRQLYPQLDLWTTAKPFLERWMSEQIGRRAFVGKIRKNLPELVEHLPDLPHKLHTIIDDAARGRLEIKWRSKELEMLRKQLRYNQRNTISAISGGAMLLSGTLVLIFGSGSLLPVSLATALGIGLGAGGGFLLIKSWFDITDKKAVSRYKL
jgi:ubiquinone biosynthesis protein